MNVTPIRPPEPSPLGRALTLDAVASEIMAGTRSIRWVRTHVPRSCRVAHNTRPLLYWERPTREWWERSA